ncbi:MAG TPA: PD-(D/E)XK nuclease family protein [Solirubrobacterales bacterium]|jgi:ATP-dependent helicase/DNAse subunit B
MSLELIVGPPNSGRAGAVLDRIRAAIDRDPVLVVPAADDATRFEQDLCRDGGAVGVTIRTFAALVEDVATLAGASPPPTLSRPQRLAVVRAAVAATPLHALARSAHAPGFAIALDDLIAELQAALVSPDELRAAAAGIDGGGAHERELAELYAAYVRLRDGAGRTDPGGVAIAATEALRARPDAWGARPVFFYGFDDLTAVQLELVRLLAARTEVTFALTYTDRRALAARARLYSELLNDPGADAVHELDSAQPHTAKASLVHLDRYLFEAEAPAAPAEDDGLRLLECAGERGEAEAVGLEIARLLADGVRPDEIVVALRHPTADGPLFAAVLRGMGIPVALEASFPLERTAVGRGLVTLCRAASEEGTPADLIAHLRADPSTPPELVDWAERGVYRGRYETVADVYAEWESPPRHLARLLEARGAAERLRALAATARELAEAPHRERAPLVGERSDGTPLDPIELRAGIAAAELLEELAVIGSLPGCEQPDLAEAAEAIASAVVPAWRGSVEGRVRITSPYRLRASRARYLFCCSLQEGSFPNLASADPLIGEQGRADLGIPALRREKPEDEERYLFHVCVSRPTERLYLSWRASDDEGQPCARSPFIDEVLDLLEPDAEERLKRTRGLAHPVPEPHEAPDARTLARSLALRYGTDSHAARDALATLDADLETTGAVLALLDGLPDPDALPGPLANPVVLADFSARRLLSAGSLENWIQCSYRWFVEHELQPQRLEPPADPLWLGGVVHEALAKLYAEQPGDDALPRPGDLGRWKRRFDELFDELLADPERGAVNPARRLLAERARRQVQAFLETEAQRDTDLRPRPDLLEVGFGFEEDGEATGPLELGEFALRGRIDRIDVGADGRTAVLHDYKTAASVTGRSKLLEEGKLQIQLYALAAEQQLGLRPIGALYHPLGARGKDRRPRGVLIKDEAARIGFDTVRGDPVDPETFEEELTRARELAQKRGAAMRAGAIKRDPIGGECPRYCTYQAICRLERAIGLEDANGGNGEAS